jgi:hypothetical protein
LHSVEIMSATGSDTVIGSLCRFSTVFSPEMIKVQLSPFQLV